MRSPLLFNLRAKNKAQAISTMLFQSNQSQEDIKRPVGSLLDFITTFCRGVGMVRRKGGDNDKAEKWRIKKRTCFIEGVCPIGKTLKRFWRGLRNIPCGCMREDKRDSFRDQSSSWILNEGDRSATALVSSSCYLMPAC
jgi:hypothetical protein